MRRILLAIALGAAAGEVHAQTDGAPTADSPAPAPGLIHGFSIERYQLDQSLVFSYRATQYRPRGPGLDLGVGIMTRWLASGVLAGMLDIGAAQATTMGSSLLFLRGGAGALVLAGEGYGGLLPALQAGLALVIPLDSRAALRLDLGEHFYLIDRELEPRWSAGIGFAVLPEGR
jgi:hypothetical protein